MSLAQATPAHADTVADPSKSKGTLLITDGELKLDSISDLDFGTVAYEGKEITQSLPTDTAKATVTDTTAAQVGWNITAQALDNEASLTVNDQLIKNDSASVIFNHTGERTDYGEQSIAIDKAKTNINLSRDQAQASVADKTGDAKGKVTVNVKWTLTAGSATGASKFNL